MEALVCRRTLTGHKGDIVSISGVYAHRENGGLALPSDSESLVCPNLIRRIDSMQIVITMILYYDSV